MENSIVSAWAILGVISWATSFLIVRKSLKNRSFDLCNRIVSAMHAALAVCLASLSVQDWSRPIHPLASPPSPPQMKTLVVTLSYLIYDLACCFLGNQLHLDNLVHHSVSIVGIGACLACGKSGSELVAALWVTEISTPFLHAREIIKELAYRDTDINLVVDILFAVIFTFGRMVGGPCVTYSTWKADNPLLIKAMAMGLQLVSVYWFFKILRMVRYKLNKRSLTKKEP